MLPSKNRISRKNFPSHKMKGFRVFSPFFTVVFYKKNITEAKNYNISVVVSKKIDKSAVERNRLRRRFYDLFGQFLVGAENVTIVVYPKVTAKREKFPVLVLEVKKALKQVNII